MVLIGQESDRLGHVVALTAILVVAYAAGQIVYNLFFHPLRSFPGPLLFRATRMGWAYHLVAGDMNFKLLDFHKKYGPVVRIAPNELAFADPQAWKDIYGHRTGNASGTQEFKKYPTFYQARGIPPNVVTADRDMHAILRRQLAHGFSDRSMRAQEPIIGSYVDLMIQRLREFCTDTDAADSDAGSEKKSLTNGHAKSKAVDMRNWMNFTTFDVIGDLAFGAPFGGLESADYNPWVKMISMSLREGAALQSMKAMGLEWVTEIIKPFMMKSREQHFANVATMLEKRIAMKQERPDLIEGFLKKQDDLQLSFKELQMNASLLIIAGSETTATLLSGVLYLLLMNPKALEKVTQEVRSSFASDEDITLLSVNNLTYMLACLNEALRVYPPVPTGLPRMVPKGGATVCGRFIPEDTVVGVWQWASYHLDTLWTEPFEYRPERFLGDPKYADDKVDILQPFSIGPRNCIGRNLAFAEMRLILARILFNFDMELADDCKTWINHKSYVLWAKPPLNVYLTPVN